MACGVSGWTRDGCLAAEAYIGLGCVVRGWSIGQGGPGVSGWTHDGCLTAETNIGLGCVVRGWSIGQGGPGVSGWTRDGCLTAETNIGLGCVVRGWSIGQGGPGVSGWTHDGCLTAEANIGLGCVVRGWSIGQGGPGVIPLPSLSLHFPSSAPSTLSFTFPFLTRFIYFLAFSISSHSTRIVPLRFQAGCHRRRLILALVFLSVDFVLYVFFS